MCLAASHASKRSTCHDILFRKDGTSRFGFQAINLSMQSASAEINFKNPSCSFLALSYGKTVAHDHAGNDGAGMCITEGSSHPMGPALPIRSMICIPGILEYLGLILLGSPDGDQKW
jgi:hypothetical protein